MLRCYDMNYVKFKLNNEMELCEVSDLELKEKIEKLLLKNRISYYIRWNTSGFFAKLFSATKKDVCIFCVNESQQETAHAIISELFKESDHNIKFLTMKVDKIYF